jgi:hypothetical protein
VEATDLSRKILARPPTVLFAKPGMLPEKVLADWAAQARKADMEVRHFMPPDMRKPMNAP